MIRASLGVFFVHRLAVLAAAKSPVQFVYDASTATSEHADQGCTVTSWDGTDPDGMTGPPWVSYVNCSKGATYKYRGVSTKGSFQVWLHHGHLSVQGQRLSNMGESFWIASGVYADIAVTGSAYVAGAKFILDESAKPVTYTSAFVGPQYRNYSYADALAKRGQSLLQHDDHICNGSSPSMDFVFGSHSGVDPPVVSVLNCAPDSTPEKNFVWSHFHPFGALYMPFSGEICFATKEVLCVQPGTARWTSANLQYYEYFRKINVSNADADRVRDLAGVDAAKCKYPNLFAVTNFDGFNPPAGVPNFADWPVNAHGSTSAAGIGPWGVFPKMAVQATRVIAKVADVEVDSEANVKHTLV